MKEFIGTGKTIEEATLAAKVGLNAPMTADVKIEIVAMPKKKVLGLFGGSDAKVKASFDDSGMVKKQPKPKKTPAEKKSAQKKNSESKKQAPKKTPKAVQEPKKPVVKPERERASEEEIDLDYVCSYIKTIIDGFNVENASVNAKFDDGIVVVDIECDDYGIIIGRRGETLDSLQYLASLAIKNSVGKYARVAINVGDYRARREETLRALAIKNANYVVRSGRRYGFEPMNPYERRIIHTAVQEVEGATSRSIGYGNERRVLIEPIGAARYNNRGPKRNGRSNTAPSQPVDTNREKRVDRADMPKFGKIEVNKD